MVMQAARKFLAVGLFILVLGVGAVEAAGPDYRIGISDSVQVFVWGNPDLGATGVVRPDGKLSIPLVGDVFVQGMTTEELQRVVLAKLKEYVREPTVTIMMAGMASYAQDHKITVLGEVTAPKSIPYREGITIIDAIIEAGWFTPYASMNKVTVVRKEGDKAEKIPVQFRDIYKKLDLSQVMDLKDGDLIVVP
ncbi:MAG: sugar ABC transporter substrate-binding protein [Deltaproteobacteria bacterium]|nr:sugar ABC transporter substrate-binding protein [Deltaproteobacteria bacterium]